MAEDDATTNKQALTALNELYEALDDAYWVATTVEAKDRIYGLSRAVYDEITALNRLAIAERGKLYAPLKLEVKRVSDRLKRLQDDIDEIIQAIDTITKVVEAAGKVISILGKFIP